jgi:preprotein translocase subunit SecG
MGQILHILYILLCVAQVLIGVSLIFVVQQQESKTEGLTGQIGTAVQSSFKGLAGREEKMNLLTRNLAIAFFAVSILVAVTTGRW